MSALTQSQRVVRMYRSMIKTSRDWIVDIEYWRQNALEIRARFDKNLLVTDRRTIERLIVDGEKLLEKYRHPNPYICPTGVEGTSWERNIPLSSQVVYNGFGNFDKPGDWVDKYASHGSSGDSHGHGHGHDDHGHGHGHDSHKKDAAHH